MSTGTDRAAFEPAARGPSEALASAARAARRARWRAHLELGRVSNLPTVWSNVLAASLLCGGAWTVPGVALAALACSCLYVAGMYFNDACDVATDARERPGRPIPSGRVSLAEARAGAALWCLAGLALAAGARFLSPAASDPGELGWLVAFSALVASIALYDLTHDDTPLGPVLMALCRVFVLAGAALLLVPVPGEAVAGLAAMSFAWITGLTRLARDEATAAAPGGAAARRGWRWRSAWPYAALGLAPLAGLVAAPRSALAAALALGTLAVGVRARALMRSATPGAFPAAVGSLVAAVALVDAIALAAAGHAVASAAAALCFAATLAWQRRVAGS